LPDRALLASLGGGLYRSLAVSGDAAANAILDARPALDALLGWWDRATPASAPGPVPRRDDTGARAPEQPPLGASMSLLGTLPPGPAMPWWTSGTTWGWLTSLALSLVLVGLQGRRLWPAAAARKEGPHGGT
jgi:hypothetical protein